MTKKTLTKSDLAQFTGNIIWYRHRLVKNIHYTEGVRYVAQAGGAYWLIDEIAFAQAEPKVQAEPFQLWKLAVGGDKTAMLSCEYGNNNEVFVKRIGFTDFPLDETSFYFTDTLILLPGEY